MLFRGLATLGVLVALTLSARASTINFDDVAPNTAIGGRYDAVTFSLSTGRRPYVYESALYAKSGRNALINRGRDMVVGHLKMTFDDPVDNLSFFYSAEDSWFRVRVAYEGGVERVRFGFDHNSTDNDLADLSRFAGITSITILERRLRSGRRDAIIIDDVSFLLRDPSTAPVPLPPGIALLASGIGAFGLLTYRRRVRRG